MRALVKPPYTTAKDGETAVKCSYCSGAGCEGCNGVGTFIVLGKYVRYCAKHQELLEPCIDVIVAEQWSSTTHTVHWCRHCRLVEWTGDLNSNIQSAVDMGRLHVTFHC